MAEVDLERLVLPALLTLLVLGAFVILATSGGGEPARPGPLPATARPARESPAPQHRFVKVQPGDTATSIAETAGITVDRLAELNPSLDPSTLRPGQTLKLAP
jgi:LysM domain